MSPKLSLSIIICLLIVIAATTGYLGEQYSISILSLIGLGIAIALCCVVIAGFFYGIYQGIKEAILSYKRKHK